MDYLATAENLHGANRWKIESATGKQCLLPSVRQLLAVVLK